MDEQPARIAVIGSPGGGKSTLATAIAAASGLPLFHLDREYWRPGWVPSAADEWMARCEHLAAGEAWVIDGNYGSSLPLRLRRATLVVWLDLPTRVCLAGAIRRALRYRRGGRADMAAGCPERFDAEYLKFLGYIATFRRRKRPAIVRALAAAGVPVIRLRTVAERTAFTRAVAAGQGMARLASSRIDRP